MGVNVSGRLQSSRRGASEVHIATDAKQAPSEHYRDVAIASAAQQKTRAKIVAMKANGLRIQASLLGLNRVLDGMLRALARDPWAKLTDRQRDICARAAGLAEVPPADPKADVPEVLRVLPKAPPGRRAP
jgi:hypothetical protein